MSPEQQQTVADSATRGAQRATNLVQGKYGMPSLAMLAFCLLLNQIGRMLMDQGKYDEAQPLYREALKVKRETLGDRHPSTLSSISNLGSLLQDQGKLDEARARLEASLDMRYALHDPQREARLQEVAREVSGGAGL